MEQVINTTAQRLGACGYILSRQLPLHVNVHEIKFDGERFYIRYTNTKENKVILYSFRLDGKKLLDVIWREEKAQSSGVPVHPIGQPVTVPKKRGRKKAAA